MATGDLTSMPQQLNFGFKDISAQEWKDMPEYRLAQHKAIRTIKINFETEEGIVEFERLIGQKIYPTRENYWYPAWHESMYPDSVYVDGGDES